MMVYQENIAPPTPLPSTDDETTKLKLKVAADEDRWVKNFIDRLTGVLRSTQGIEQEASHSVRS
jgi:hypothetical protein